MAETVALPFAAKIPFVEAQGFVLLRFEGGTADVALEVRPEQRNSFGVLHGGVTMTLLDVAMAHAARSPHAGRPVDPRGVVTVEMKTSFVRPALDRVTARGRVLHRTATLAFCEASLVDDEGQLLAHATGTFKYLRALPVGGRELNGLNASD